LTKRLSEYSFVGVEALAERRLGKNIHWISMYGLYIASSKTTDRNCAERISGFSQF